MKKFPHLSTLIAGAALLSLVSCGGDGGSSSKPKSSSKSGLEVEQEDDQGYYRAVLKPLNSTLLGTTTGTIKIKIEGDDFIVDGYVAGAPQGVKHLQNIMTGRDCPTELSDTNKDSIVDITEALNTSGSILIPLDSNLSTQLEGISYGPIANSAGTYKYKRSTTLSQLLSDLSAPDPDMTDAIEKLPLGESLNLKGRVIIIHGVRSSANLPHTVKGLGDSSPEMMLPIACGKIERVKSDFSTEPETTVVTE